MHKVSKKQRKALRSTWKLGKSRKLKDHVRRISNAMERSCRTRSNSF
jgi:hypothetical protein